MEKQTAIEALKSLLSDLDNDKTQLTPWEGNAINTLQYIFPDRGINIKDHKSSSFQEDRFSKLNYRQYLTGIIRDIEIMGLPERQIVSPHNLINVSQQLNVHFIVDGLKDFLTEMQLEDLKQAYNNGKTPGEKKLNLLNKIKSFGSDVGSNILANILTNPSIWSSF